VVDEIQDGKENINSKHLENSTQENQKEIAEKECRMNSATNE